MPYYDFDGNEIDQKTWVNLFDKTDRIIGHDRINGHRISTVWLGLDHGWSGLPPLIFKSKIFCELTAVKLGADGTAVALHGPKYCDWHSERRRYATKEEARQGHAILCNNMRGERHDEQEGL